MSEASVRDLIARAIFDSDHVDYHPLSRDEIWGDPRGGSRTRDEYYANADAVLAVLADPPADVIEQAAKAFYEGTPGGLPNWGRMSVVEPDLAETYRRHISIAFKAVFGGEPDA